MHIEGTKTNTVLQSIEKELLERLKKGVYGDIYNYPVDKYNEILDKEVGKTAVSEDEEEEVMRQSLCTCFISLLFLLRIRCC